MIYFGMKVIDLLNMIANNEELPNKIKIRTNTLVCNNDHIRLALQDYYYMENEENATWKIWYYDLNDDVEIIEEDKTIEPLECYDNAFVKGCMSEYYEKDFEKAVKHNFKVIRNKIGEIIDKINSMED